MHCCVLGFGIKFPFLIYLTEFPAPTWRCNSRSSVMELGDMGKTVWFGSVSSEPQKRESRHCLASDLGRASQTAGLRDGSRVKATQRFHRKGEEDEALTLASISSVSHLPLACLCQRSTCLGFSTSNVGAGQRAGDSHVNCSILSIRHPLVGQ